MRLYKLPTILNEQAQPVISDDLNQRLKEYLNNEKLLSELSKNLDKYEDGEYELTALSKEEYGILNGDKLFVRVNKEDKDSPKFFMWILNDQYLWGDIDMDVAASLLKAGGTGTSFSEKGIIGSIGSFLSGGGEDSGTDEETIACLAGAFAKIAAEKSIDPQLYFDKLDEIFKEKYDKSITTFLEEEFSGYAEAVALNVYRRKVEPSVWRGLNVWSIIGDSALLLLTFGGSAVFTAGLRGSRLAGAASKAGKLGKGSSTLGKGTIALANMAGKANTFAKLSAAKKIEALAKAGVSAGKTIKYEHGAAGLVDHTVVSISEKGGIVLKALTGTKNTFNIPFSYIIKNGSPKTAQAALSAAGINFGAAGVIVAKKGEESVSSDSEKGVIGTGAEMLGYYDKLKSDPQAYLENVKSQGSSDIASTLFELKNGSGLFGNTTNQEEGAIALLITGLIPEMINLVKDQYSKIDPKMSVYSVLDDELDGDISIFAKAYWTGCTDEGSDYKAPIDEIIKRLKK